jgi:Poly A polymerase head domain
MDDAALRAVFADEEAWIVGGAVRDELLGRRIVDIDVACRAPRAAAHRFAKQHGGAPFPLSERHGAWRVIADGAEETVDFTPLPADIETDLATRDFTINAIAVPLGGGGPIDPHGGLGDLEARVVRAVSHSAFEDDPLRLLRAVRIEEELGFRMDERTEALVRAAAARVNEPAGERILAELRRTGPAGMRRLQELGLLAPLGGSLAGPYEALDDPDFRLVAVFGEGLRRLPISNELRRYARTLMGARPPDDGSPRAVHRFRRATEPWALDALAFVGAEELTDAVEAARAADPPEPLVRGDELGLPPGPAIGRILARIDEERAAGTVATREDALELARALAAEAGA